MSTYSEMMARFTPSFISQASGTNVSNLVSVIATEIDEFMAANATLALFNVITSQSGINLDQIGKIVGQIRSSGQNDADYRGFLNAAILEGFSSGSNKEILDVCYTIKGIIAGTFVFIEDYNLNWPIYLDGSRVLDGKWPLVPNFDDFPASFEVRMTQDVSVAKSDFPLAIGNGVQRSRAAGVNGYGHAIYQVCVASGTRQYNGGPATGGVIQMAFGDGATGTAQPGDIGLTHEIARRQVSANIFPSGTYAQWTLPLWPWEYNSSKGINELALFSSGGVILAKVSGFTPLVKDQTLMVDYIFINH